MDGSRAELKRPKDDNPTQQRLRGFGRTPKALPEAFARGLGMLFVKLDSPDSPNSKVCLGRGVPASMAPAPNSSLLPGNFSRSAPEQQISGGGPDFASRIFSRSLPTSPLASPASWSGPRSPSRHRTSTDSSLPASSRHRRVRGTFLRGRKCHRGVYCHNFYVLGILIDSPTVLFGGAARTAKEVGHGMRAEGYGLTTHAVF